MKNIPTSTHIIFAFLTIVLLCLFISLGTWQIHRGQMKQSMLTLEAEKNQSHPLSNSTLLHHGTQQPEHYQFSQAKLQGQFDNEHHILLDNQIQDGQVGYQVITPLQLEAGNIILVNRGFMPLPGSRANLPRIKPIQGRRLVQGQLEIPSQNPMIRATETELEKRWPKRVQKISITDLQADFSGTLLPWVLVLYEKSSETYEPLLKRQQWLNPERHYGYAFQWFSFAIILFGLYLYFMFLKKR